MNLVDKQVVHKSFGKGKVVQHNNSYIEINFDFGNKRFVFPDAFKTYLKLNDKSAESLIRKIIEQKEEERKEKEEEIKKIKAQKYEERQHRLKREKLMKSNKSHSSSQVVFWCEEQELDKVFTDWSIFTGRIKSGAKKGQPNRLARMNQNSACLLTIRESNMAEEDRRIVGLYMVEENFNGKLCEDGYIPAHSEYRLRLSEEESQKMLFWNYYSNKSYPGKIVWNTGRYRYFDNIIMAQILRDVLSLKNNPEEQEDVQRFLEYFCKINHIDEKNLPKADGTLLHLSNK